MAVICNASWSVATTRVLGMEPPALSDVATSTKSWNFKPTDLKEACTHCIHMKVGSRSFDSVLTRSLRALFSRVSSSRFFMNSAVLPVHKAPSSWKRSYVFSCFCTSLFSYFCRSKTSLSSVLLLVCLSCFSTFFLLFCLPAKQAFCSLTGGALPEAKQPKGHENRWKKPTFLRGFLPGENVLKEAWSHRLRAANPGPRNSSVK